MDSLKINQFLDHLILERRLSEHTHRNYRGSLLRFQEWLGKEISGSSLLSTNQEIARSYLIEIQSNLSRKTLANHVSALRSFFQFCQVRGWTSSNPFKNLSVPKPEKTLPKFLTESQARALMESPTLVHMGTKEADFLSTRDRIILELLYGSGLRFLKLLPLTMNI